MNRIQHLSMVCCLLASVGVMAQSEKVLKPDEINERALIDMLSPEPATPSRVKTRAINITRDESSLPAAKPAAASLLIVFETNSASLTSKGKQSLDVVGRALNSEKLTAYKFAIEGHSDPRGGEDYNLRLSQARAESVVSYLEQSHQIPATRLKPVGKGPTQLLNPARPEAPENRRVTIKRLDE